MPAERASGSRALHSLPSRSGPRNGDFHRHAPADVHADAHQHGDAAAHGNGRPQLADRDSHPDAVGARPVTHAYGNDAARRPDARAAHAGAAYARDRADASAPAADGAQTSSPLLLIVFALMVVVPGAYLGWREAKGIREQTSCLPEHHKG